MRIKSIVILFLLCPLVILSAGLRCGTEKKATALTVTMASLFEEMIDLRRLAEFPVPAYRTVQYSSYDRRSKLPGGPDWFANADGFGNEPEANFEAVLTEPDQEGVAEYLMAEVEGPGAIVRLWSAAINGTVQLYLDGSEEPLFDGSAIDFFHTTLKDIEEAGDLADELLDNTLYQRDAVYLPIPFASGMKLVWRGKIKDIHFYQVQVRIYEPGTDVETFSFRKLSENRNLINRVLKVLAAPDREWEGRKAEQIVTGGVSVNGGEEKEVITREGSWALEMMTLKLEADDIDAALRQTVLQIRFDGAPWGQVQSPLGDFFAAAPGVNPYISLPFSVKPDGSMVCRFFMPFKKSLSVTVANHGDQEVTVKGEFSFNPYRWIDDLSMHFRARWRINHDLLASPSAVQDLPFLIAVGRGVYIGTTSYLMNPNEVPTPYGNWWGEGDEKVFVDADRIPSVFGTGSEDYYNYSWSSPDIFDYPYCGQPRNDGPGNRGFVTNYRWQLLDPLPFNSHIRFYMELYSHEPTPGLSYARIGYHYAFPGTTDDHMAIMPNDLRLQKLPENWQPAARMGARNSIFYAAEKLLDGGDNTRMENGRLWAGGKLMIWQPNESEEQISFKLPIGKSGQKRIHFCLALRPDSGRIKVFLDGEAVKLTNRSDELNLFRPYRTLLRNFTIPPREFSAGNHRLTFRFSGADSGPQSVLFGFDFFWIQDSGN